MSGRLGIEDTKEMRHRRSCWFHLLALSSPSAEMKAAVVERVKQTREIKNNW